VTFIQLALRHRQATTVLIMLLGDLEAEAKCKITVNISTLMVA